MKDFVGVLIADLNKEQFCIQQVCGGYPVEEYRQGYSIIGGNVREKETPWQALLREMTKEFPQYASDLIIASAIDVGQYIIEYSADSEKGAYNYFLYESLLEINQVLDISKLRIREKKGTPKCVLKTKNELENLNLIWGLEKAVNDYFKKVNCFKKVL